MEFEISDSQALVKLRCFEEGVKSQTEKESWCREPISCTSEVLEALTDNFKEENFISLTTYGKVYRGKVKLDSIGAETRDVTVKIWDEKVHVINDGKVVDEEVRFLSHFSMNHHPNLVRLIGFSSNGYRYKGPVTGVVYDLNSLDTLYNHTLKDTFSWIQRIKVALEFAKLLEYLHNRERPYVVFNIDSTNIMLDQAYNPILIDFGLLSGGIMGGRRFAQEFGHMSPGYCDPFYAKCGMRCIWSDVFSFGLILLGLIAKRVDLKEDLEKRKYQRLNKWATEVYKHGCSLVHPNLREDKDFEESDGIKLTELAMCCIQVEKAEERPAMTQVVKSLENLSAFQVLSEYAHKDKRMKLGGK
ncbi:hypothetical protein LguiB_032162 [Lonicera macranthoides]